MEGKIIRNGCIALILFAAVFFFLGRDAWKPVKPSEPTVKVVAVKADCPPPPETVVAEAPPPQRARSRHFTFREWSAQYR